MLLLTQRTQKTKNLLVLNFAKTCFTTSADKLGQCPKDSLAEVAFVGRSNAGKSSALNVLTQQKKLARTSKTPGRTQLINFFEVTPDRYLVDLPGYGYAKVSADRKAHWQRLLGNYLQKRDALRGLVLLMDIRHPLQAGDEQLINWCFEASLPLHILLTKADKFKFGKAKSILLQVQKSLQDAGIPATIQCFSALKKTGLEELSERITEWLSTDN